MSIAMALLLAAQAMPPAPAPPGPVMLGAPPMPMAADARRPVSLWIGSDEALDFRFGGAMATSLAASPSLRAAFPVDSAAYRLVLTGVPRPRGADGRFTYRLEVRRTAPKDRERFVARFDGACTTTTIDSCASTVMDRIARRLGG